MTKREFRNNTKIQNLNAPNDYFEFWFFSFLDLFRILVFGFRIFIIVLGPQSFKTFTA